jgi:hypothetical protein
MGLGVTACCNEAADEREGRERGTGEFRLGQHGFLHPFESGAVKVAAYPLVVSASAKVQMVEKPIKSCACREWSPRSENVEISLLQTSQVVMASAQ